MVFVDTMLRLRHAYLGAGEWAENIDVATIGGSTVAIAPRGSLNDAIGPRTTTVDTGNTYAYPGFVDSHTHTKRAALIGTTFLDCGAGAVSSLTEILANVSRRSSELRDGEWLQGDNLNPSYLLEGRFPNRYELDAAGGGRPVILRGSGRHVVAASSSALAAAGIDSSTLDPPGGRIERDADEVPTGILHERAKLRLDVTQPNTVVPKVSVEIRLDGLRSTLRRFHGYGTTMIHEIPRNPDELSDYLQLRAAGELSMRVVFYIRGWEAATRLEYLTGLGLRSDFGDDKLRIGGVKFSIDGSASFRNAAVVKEYPFSGGDHGLVRIEEAALAEHVAECRRAGLRVAVHAIGDRALDIALGAYEAASAEYPADPVRGPDRIEHAFVAPGRERLERMARLGLTLSQQPGFIESAARGYAQIFDDPVLADWLPVASAISAGVEVILNSDYPNAPANPFTTLRCAVTRASSDGQIAGVGEAVDIQTAFGLMTTATARVSGLAGRIGAIAEGHLADIFVTDQQFFDTPPDELEGTNVRRTIVGGEVVHESTA
jgi:predicted amidohydrolase YtcJ